jgi:methionyl-tRNA synthetase
MSEIKEHCNRCKRFNYSTHCDFCGVECIKTGEQNGGYGLDWCGDCEKRHKIQECWFALIRKTKEEFVSTINAIKNVEQKASRNPESLKVIRPDSSLTIIQNEKKKVKKSD